MWFKSLSAYRLPPAFSYESAQFFEKLEQARLKPLGPVEPSRFGFISPYGRDKEVLIHENADFAWFELGGREKVLPGSVVKEACDVKFKLVKERTGKNPGKRQREQIRDDVLLDLLPRAFEKGSRLGAYIDRAEKLLVVDTTSDKAAERMISALREAFGTFIAEPIQTEESVGALMTAWIAESRCPEPFMLGDECALVDPIDTACAVKAKRHDLTLDEIREHVKTGKKVSQLALIFDNRLSFVLDDKFKIRKLKFLDVIQDAIKETEGEMDAMTELDTRFTLMTLEVRRLMHALHDVFKLQ